jgi:hypothetical protein
MNGLRMGGVLALAVGVMLVVLCVVFWSQYQKADLTAGERRTADIKQRLNAAQRELSELKAQAAQAAAPVQQRQVSPDEADLMDMPRLRQTVRYAFSRLGRKYGLIYGVADAGQGDASSGGAAGGSEFQVRIMSYRSIGDVVALCNILQALPGVSISKITFFYRPMETVDENTIPMYPAYAGSGGQGSSTAAPTSGGRGITLSVKLRGR